jgi:hypothetical protein
MGLREEGDIGGMGRGCKTSKLLELARSQSKKQQRRPIPVEHAVYFELRIPHLVDGI